MKRTISVLVASLMFLTSSCSMMAEESSKKKDATWQPKKTWIMMVGVGEYAKGSNYSDMPDDGEGADDLLYNTFIKCGVPKDQIVFLTDKKATLKNINKEFVALLKKSDSDATLITYFTGHGTVDNNGNGYFANYDAGSGKKWKNTTWSVESIYKNIEEHFEGSTAILAADCCHSGTLSSQLKTLKTEKAYATMSSSLARLESGMYWTFTESLVSGFLGTSFVDSNSDGKVSMSELKTHSRTEMAVFLQQETTFSKNKIFPDYFNLVVAEKKQHKDIGKYVEIKIGKRRGADWAKAKIVEVKDGKIRLAHYINDGLVFTILPADSKNIREFSRKIFKMGDVIDVKDGRRWRNAILLSIEAETGLHEVAVEDEKGWDGLFFYEDLRLRPTSLENKE